MKIYSVGKRMGDTAIVIPKSILTESVPGQFYELQMKTQGVENPDTVARMLGEKLKEKFGIEIHYFEVDDNIMTIQIEGSPFAWNTVLIFLPEILLMLGVVVTIIITYLIVAGIPSWKWGVLVVGLAFVSLTPRLVSKFALLKETRR